MITRERMQEQAVRKARDEMAEDSLVAVDTYLQMAQLGLDADQIVEQLELEFVGA